MLKNSLCDLGLNLQRSRTFVCLPLLIAHQNCSPEPQGRFEVWESSCQVLPGSLTWVSPISILALLLSSCRQCLIKVAVESLCCQLGLLPSLAVCPVLAGVTCGWLALEVDLLSRNYFFKPQVYITQCFLVSFR